MLDFTRLMLISTQVEVVVGVGVELGNTVLQYNHKIKLRAHLNTKYAVTGYRYPAMAYISYFPFMPILYISTKCSYYEANKSGNKKQAATYYPPATYLLQITHVLYQAQAATSWKMFTKVRQNSPYP